MRGPRSHQDAPERGVNLAQQSGLSSQSMTLTESSERDSEINADSGDSGSSTSCAIAPLLVGGRTCAQPEALRAIGKVTGIQGKADQPIVKGHPWATARSEGSGRKTCDGDHSKETRERVT
jgi:hypothetical protein